MDAAAAFCERFFDSRVWADTTWFGTQALKNPLDLWVYQEILFECRPDAIIETGTFKGGSALFLAHMLDLLGRGVVVTIDLEEIPGRPGHPRIRYLQGSSAAPETVAAVRSLIAPGDRAMVILDSDHSFEHVSRELDLYAEFVSPGGYLIVEDTVVNGHPILPEFGPGPFEAVAAFLRRDDRFQRDATREKFMLTFNPCGFLRRVT